MMAKRHLTQSLRSYLCGSKDAPGKKYPWYDDHQDVGSGLWNFRYDPWLIYLSFHLTPQSWTWILEGKSPQHRKGLHVPSDDSCSKGFVIFAYLVVRTKMLLLSSYIATEKWGPWNCSFQGKRKNELCKVAIADIPAAAPAGSPVAVAQITSSRASARSFSISPCCWAVTVH